MAVTRSVNGSVGQLVLFIKIIKYIKISASLICT